MSAVLVGATIVVGLLALGAFGKACDKATRPKPIVVKVEDD